MELAIFLNRIEDLCKQKGLKRQNVYIKCGVGKDFGVSLRNGSAPSIEKVYALADYLDCSVDYLLGRTDNPQSHKSSSSVSVGAVSGNSGAIGVGNTVTNAAPQFDEQTADLFETYKRLNQLNRSKLRVYADDLEKGCKK